MRFLPFTLSYNPYMSYKPKGVFLAALIYLTLLASTPLVEVANAQDGTRKAQTPSSITFKLSKSSVAPGEKVTITATVIDKEGEVIEDGKVKWIVPNGLENVIAKGEQSDTQITIIGLNPPAGESKLTSNIVPIIAQVIGAEGITSVASVPLEALPVARGPIPPGLDPQVDIMWSVLPNNVTGHNFGRAVKNNYYAVEIVIGNNTGFDLQVASVGFELPKNQGINTVVPSAGFRVARASGERARALYPRNLILNTIRAFGPFLTGFTSFFHNINRRSNFSEAVNIFSNPLEKGIELVIPDLSIDELNRLQDQLIRDDITTRTVIPNNTQVRTMVLVPKRFVNVEGDRDDPKTVMKALGSLVLRGTKVEYLNRLRVVAMPAEGNEFSISGQITDGCNNGLAGVTVTLTGGAGDFNERSATTDSEGNYSFDDVPSGAKYTVIPKFNDLTFKPARGSRDSIGSEQQSFILDQRVTNVDFETTQEEYTISGKVTGVDASKTSTVNVVVKRGTETVGDPVAINEDGTYSVSVAAGKEYTVTVPDTDDYSFTPASGTSVSLKCDKKDLNFKATPKPKKEAEPASNP